jgi:hypothetical protein
MDTSDRRPAAADEAGHRDELPCIVAYGAEGGLVPFLEWVVAETRGG